MSITDAGLVLENGDGAGGIVYRPLIPATLALVGGIVLGAWLPGHVYLSVGVFLTGMTGCLVQVMRHRPALVAPLMMFCSLGYFSLQPWTGGHLPANHVRHFVGQGRWRVTGTISDAPVFKAGRVQFVLDATHLVQNDSDQAVCGKIQVTVLGDGPDPARGDRVDVTGYLNTIRNFHNPGGFDYERYMALQGIRVRLFVRDDKIRILASGGRTSWRSRLDALRHRLGRHMDRALTGHAHEAPALLKAVILGDRSGMPVDLRDRFSRAGVGHVTAISGLHVGMVAATVFFIFVRLSAWIPAMLDRGWTRKVAALFSLSAVGGYALLAGMSPSTQRAAVMAAVVLLALYWIGRRHDWFNAVAVAALVIGVFNPPAVLSISFQLSFCAVLSILAGVGSFSANSPRTEQGRLNRWLRRILISMWVSVLAIAGTLPLVMMYFNRLSLVGVAANLVVVPLLGWWVLPLGLVGVSVCLVSPGLAYACWQLAGFGLDLMVVVVSWFSRLPFAAVQTVTPSLLEVFLYFGLLLLVLNWKKMLHPRPVLALILAVAVADGAFWIYQRFGGRDMSVTILDVGQGSANLLQLPGGRTVLVDGGGFADSSTFDVGRSLVAPYLWRLKIRTVDLVVLTHPNSDHLNGLIYILENFHVSEVWSNHETAETRGYRQWQAVIRQMEIKHPPFDRLARNRTISGVNFEILAPEPGFLQRRSHESWRDENEDSLVLRVCYGKVSFLFCGDIGRRTENGLVHGPDRGNLQSTVLLVPHHGSRYSSSPSFLRAVRPSQAVISAGWRNHYRFPHGQVLERLAALSCDVWRTDQCGAIRFATDGAGYSVKTVLNCR